MYSTVPRGSLKDVQAAAEKHREEFAGHAPHAAAAAARARKEAKDAEAKQPPQKAEWTKNPLTRAESIV
jgi:hypothetical protein